MWLIFIFLGSIFLYYWININFLLFGWILAICAFFQGQFIRGGLWSCAFIYAVLALAPEEGSNALVDGKPVYIGIMSLCLLAAFIRLWNRQTLQSVPPFGTMPETTGNIVPFIKATRDERERVMAIQGHHCANPYCNTDLRQSVPHWDHIVPRSQGGTDSVHNMQWLCETCNMNKKDQHWLEFLFKYAKGMGQDPNMNQEPWKKWVLTRANNGLQCG